VIVAVVGSGGLRAPRGAPSVAVERGGGWWVGSLPEQGGEGGGGG
jgi:hypothetical protein